MNRLRRLIEPVNWKYAIREVSLIVTGVLIALAANGWWIERQEYVDEQRYLRQLLSDFAANNRNLTLARNAEARITDASWRLHRAAHWETPPPDTLAAWFRASAVVAPLRPVTGTLLALIQTGDIKLIRNDSLRSRLVAFAGRVEQDLQSLRQAEAAMIEITAERNRMVDMGEYMAHARQLLVGMSRRPFRVDWNALLQDPAFNALASTTGSASVSRWRILESLLTDVRDIRWMLMAELQEPPPAPFCAPRSAASAAADAVYEGIYESQLSRTKITREESGLRVEATALWGPLVPVDTDAFCAPEAEALLQFHRDASGRISQLSIEQWGRTFRGPRL